LKFLLAYILIGAAGIHVASADVPVPYLTSPVTDLTSTLSISQKEILEKELLDFERAPGSQLAVLIVFSTKPEEIELYSLRVVEKWRLGRDGVDDGALLLIAKNDRRLRIEVEYGLEGILTDATCKRIIDEIITPRFKAGDSFGGIQAGLRAMIQVLRGEPLPSQPAGAPPTALLVFILFMPVIFGILMVRKIRAASWVQNEDGWYSSHARWQNLSGGRSSSFHGGGGRFGGGGASGRW